MEDQWEMGLPSNDELIPLTQSLITPELAFAFGITIGNCRSLIDLNKVSFDTFPTNRPKDESCNFDGMNLRLFPSVKRGGEVNPVSKGENGTSRAVKRPRLVWTPELHKRFVDVIEHLGINKAVPKTIMEMMNVEGLTRENVASHLQKYRIYLKRVDGLANDAQSATKRAPTLFDCDGFGSFSTPMPMALPQAHLHDTSLPLMPMSMPMSMVGPSLGAYGGGFGSGQSGFNCGIESGGFDMFWNQQRG
ncbi:hypothetical protein RND81_08G217000 [Saponaria officinalis]|uniref:HTH myb-type domain-containing protein n=1 Tax=Saponaria officinalis TaxID=3572 RepID=A0AAW1J9F2_SAPOF